MSIDDIINIHRREMLRSSYHTRSNGLVPEKNRQKYNGSLHQKFFEYFRDSTISEYYWLKEVQNRPWEFEIYRNDVIDRPYIVCSEDNESVSQVPNGVKFHWIHERNRGFTRNFIEFMNMLEIDYEKLYADIFNMCRQSEFPYPHYSDEELRNCWQNLRKLNTREMLSRSSVGIQIVRHFHPSIYDANIDGYISPRQAWDDDDMMKKVIRNRVIYKNRLDCRKIMEGFTICKEAMKVSVFSSAKAKQLVNNYLSEFETVFDPFSGFSGRMLGVCSTGKQYIGQDLSEKHVKESNDIIDFLKLNATVIVADSETSTGEYDCLLTCSPYGTKEIWEDVKNTHSCDDWIDICLRNYKCKKYVFVVDNTFKYSSNIVHTYSNKSHLSDAKEYVVVITK